MSEDGRENFFICTNDNPIKITRKNGIKFDKFYIDELIVFNEEGLSLTKEMLSLEISENVDANFEKFGKQQNRTIGLFHPSLSYSSWNKENGALLLFSNDNGFSITQTHEICLYLKEHSSGQLVDFKNATIILIYSF